MIMMAFIVVYLQPGDSSGSLFGTRFSAVNISCNIDRIEKVKKPFLSALKTVPTNL
jgi:hypothetical protein